MLTYGVSMHLDTIEEYTDVEALTVAPQLSYEYSAAALAEVASASMSAIAAETKEPPFVLPIIFRREVCQKP